MNETEARLKQEIDALLAAAEKTDAEEDAQYGKEQRGDELPDELQRRESRLRKIREAKAELEDEARKRRCAASCEPRLAAPYTRCARRSSSRSSDRSRNSSL